MTKYNSPIGKLTLVSEGEYLVGLFIENQKYYMENIGTVVSFENKVLKETKVWLDKYFKGENPKINILLKPEGSPFRQLVWKYLLDIPYATTTTYKELALKVAKELNKDFMSSQAIGGAVSHNPISIIIPCHRVIGSNNTLVGYAAGKDIKEKLLELEKKTL